MRDPVLGIDISKKTFDVTLLAGESKHGGSFDNNKSGFRGLSNWLRKLGIPSVHACMEATSTYGDDLAEYLYGKGHIVYMVNPARIKAYGVSQGLRVKNDKIDSTLIAQFCKYQEKLTEFEPLSPTLKTLRFLGRRLDDLKKELVREKNRIQSTTLPAEVLSSNRRHIGFLVKEIKRIESKIDELIDSDPDLKEKRALLLTIDGIGPASSRIFITEFRGFDNFETASQAAAYAGWTPFNRSSGSSLDVSGRISRMGRAQIRAVTYMAAVASVRCNSRLGALYLSLIGRGKSKKLALCAIARHLVHIAFGVLRSGKPYDPNYVRPVFA